MVSTPEGFTDNSPRSPTTLKPGRNPISRKSLFLFTNILDIKMLFVELELLNKSAIKLEQ